MRPSAASTDDAATVWADAARPGEGRDLGPESSGDDMRSADTALLGVNAIDAGGPDGPIPSTDGASPDGRPQDGSGLNFAHPLGGAARVKARLLVGNLGFTEGPAWVAQSVYVDTPALYFASGRDVLAYTQGAAPRTFLTDVGAKGLAVDRGGRVWIAHGGRVSRLGLDRKPAASFSGGFTNANDIVVRGTAYFTNFQSSPGALRIPVTGEQVIAIEGADRNSNGIALSPDAKWLYVSVSATASRVDRFPLDERGVPGAPSPFARLSGIWADGMAVDDAGNLYVTSSIEDEKGIVEVFSPAGTLLGTIDVGIKVTNCTFGGPDRRTLFITASRSLWAVDLQVPGLP